jgi:hypothetical protein
MCLHDPDVWETSSELYLIVEYVEGGELFDYLCTRGCLAEPEALTCFQKTSRQGRRFRDGGTLQNACGSPHYAASELVMRRA